MEKHFYLCQYCAKEYKPNRRKVQKYCSNSCRTRAHVLRNPKQGKLALPATQLKPISTKVESSKTESMSWGGVANAAVGNLAVHTLAHLLTKDENKPATKKDITEMKNLLVSRYLPIQNSAPDRFGNYPFYDTETKNIVYLKTINHGK